MASSTPGPVPPRHTRQGQADEPQPPKPPKCLKVRIITWNMHDSLPKGDLEELLGAVSPHKLVPISPDSLDIPDMSIDANHPYHLVVMDKFSKIGIPMGLGAGFKLIDKEKEKEKLEDKDVEKPLLHKLKDQYEGNRGWKSSDDLAEDVVINHPTGWTSILEHWLCHRTQANPQSSDETEPIDVPLSPKRASVGNLHRRVTVKDHDKGPYVPLVKERMMGLYLAIYIHRDIRNLVKGTSKSAVTTGLIGGRVGNKGGVGISLNIDGTTLLFVNAHLAAHEGKVLHRLANLAKIKTELSVDPFLKPDDPRIMAEDVTDRFDYTFLCGDLNFRLDITRLHADWLISRQEYEQALAFDQLRKQMETNSTFAGFREASINFPPTFKYDVLRTLRRFRTKASRRHSRRSIFEKDHAGSGAEGRDHENDDDDAEEEGDTEAASMASSAWASVNSKAATDVEDDDYFDSLNSDHANGKQRLSLSAAVHKAKSKCKTLLSPALSPSLPSTPTKWRRMKQGLAESAVLFNKDPASSVPSIENIPTSLLPEPTHRPNLLDLSAKELLALPRPVSRGVSTRSIPPTTDQEDEDEDKGVYDSSHKQRVPSWCDRILWKSTVVPSLGDDDCIPENSGPKTRVGNFFSALRPHSRIRRDSSNSTLQEDIITPSHRTSIDTNIANTSIIDIYSGHGYPHAGSTQLSPKFLHHSRSTERLPQRKQTLVPPRPSTQYAGYNARLEGQSADINSPNLESVFQPSPLVTNEASLDTPPPVPPKDSVARWRFFPFRRETSQTIVLLEEPPAEVTPLPQKGDIVCLSYNTLDDRGMRRLEGRSDHRPVIGSYAIYL
ncbi:hypothetical protein SERLA73DRAFT_122843 [Serpula lacrymans var. lacrymans S7.3]|uniref:Inositol polyphosphate-related phosphatase domain-containing protein n=1 Tax=Serpula lacrymans var. lacrymans (strain S7.3) TaxID=936435 RepID=F8PYM1_SERL3|nr:hypothetical protein SERLA73DRAFT_122843 [Serpula lacrymans var. lacrymans S7.3]